MTEDRLFWHRWVQVTEGYKSVFAQMGGGGKEDMAQRIEDPGTFSQKGCTERRGCR